MQIYNSIGIILWWDFYSMFIGNGRMLYTNCTLNNAKNNLNREVSPE